MSKILLDILLSCSLSLSAQVPEIYQSTYDFINRMLIDEIPHPQLKLMTLGFAYVEQKASVHACNTANYSKIKKKMKMKMKRYEEKGINYLINKPRGLFLARHWAEPTPSVGWNQLNNYQNLFQQQYGGTWHTVLDFY